MGGLKSSMVMGDKYDEFLAKLNIIESEDNYWQKLVNTYYERSQVIIIIQDLITMIFLLVC